MTTETEIILASTIVGFLANMAVGDHCYIGQSLVWRTKGGFAVEDNGEEVEAESAFGALKIALENAAPAE